MPDKTTALIFAQIFSFPASFAHLVGNGIGSLVLITPHHLQYAVRIIGHGVKANKLMSHRDGKQVACKFIPYIDWFVMEIRPVKIIIRVEFTLRAGIGKIESLFRIHGHKNLYQREQTGKAALGGVFLDLVASLADRNAASFQFNMDDRHAVDQQQHITPAVIEKF